MKCQKGKTCVKQPAGSYPDPKIPVCTGCDKTGLDKDVEKKLFSNGLGKPFKKGERVEILRKDIYYRPKHRIHWYGRITRIDGGYHYVRPMWCKWETELYYNEIAHA